MNLSKDIIESFQKDMEGLLEGCQVSSPRDLRKTPLRVKFGWNLDSLNVFIYEGNGFTEEQGFKRAEKALESYNKRKYTVLDKWSGVFNEISVKSGVSGEGEYEVDYGLGLSIYFEFGSKLRHKNEIIFGKYLKARQELYDYLNRVVNDKEFKIEDSGDGISCSIGKYFEYVYSTGEVLVKDRIHLYKSELGDISRLVGNLFSSMRDFGVPIHHVIVSWRNPSYKVDCYLYEFENGEYLLWLDAISKYDGV